MSDEVKAISGPKNIKLSKLHVRCIPVLTPLDLWGNDMSLENSPHVELMREFLEHGMTWGNLKSTRYVRERMRRFKLGITRWTEPYIIQHLHKRYDILRSLKKEGFVAKKSKPPIQVLREPLWKTRFGCNEEWLEGREIYNGAGRCAAAMALGWESITVIMVKDAKKPGDKGKFEKKLKCIEGIW